MREILFRGKRVDNGEWVDGSYIYAHKWNWDGSAGHLICDIYGTTKTQVIPETVGQFTGLTDKNGKKIFEGDIVKANFCTNGSKQTFLVIYNNGMFLFDNKSIRVPRYEIYNVGVIGNIHDNPELLQGE